MASGGVNVLSLTPGVGMGGWGVAGREGEHVYALQDSHLPM